MTEEVLKIERRLIDNVWHSVHVSNDRKVQVIDGPDDQRPDHDGEHFFRPTCVAQMIRGHVFDYYKYCGFCSRLMGTSGRVKGYCPECGRGVAHYIFAMGVVEFEGSIMPKEWRSL